MERSSVMRRHIQLIEIAYRVLGLMLEFSAKTPFYQSGSPAKKIEKSAAAGARGRRNGRYDISVTVTFPICL
jgi:hypothetical protein